MKIPPKPKGFINKNFERAFEEIKKENTVRVSFDLAESSYIGLKQDALNKRTNMVNILRNIITNYLKKVKKWK
jgi:hypothetical protein